MGRLPRITQKIFGSNAGFEQIAQFGSLAASSPTFTTNVATMMSLPAWEVGWDDAVIGGNSPAIEDMNAFCTATSTQLGYLLEAGVPIYDPGTEYWSGDICAYPTFTFTVTSANATAGATYTNNGNTYTVQSTIASGTTLTMMGTGLPGASSGTLTKASGTGDATITFSAYVFSTGLYYSIADAQTGNTPLGATMYWLPLLPPVETGLAFQHLAINSSDSQAAYSYFHVSSQTWDNSLLTIPSGYNLNTGNMTIPSGLTVTVNSGGSVMCGYQLVVSGTLSNSGIVRIL